MRIVTTFVLLLSFGLSPAALAEPGGIVVVRHAEKADNGTQDPDLTEAGQARAGALAEALARSEIGALIATQYQRTQQTLSVLADRHDLEIAVVHAESGEVEAHIEAIARKAREADTDGLLVIAGHSNTVGLIVEALAGHVVSPIDESEYDRLFLLLPGDTGMDVIETRYGARSPAQAD
ncbi:histidine phosphatase family protein [Wenzhouxiangella sp. XN201]|uniref:SixA phosphatase family protein n=1 Tax=Wenzhouxiangella sp. XN201 TaxID=2710755 RepID=UPI0013C73DBD|nr:histidine phosphatase family protein [Wenzhouxiangella sp. XN201]NEZ03594.1 histidine phosphatase family protein [Wenzhouxiangella sp. XN201]